MKYIHPVASTSPSAIVSYALATWALPGPALDGSNQGMVWLHIALDCKSTPGLMQKRECLKKQCKTYNSFTLPLLQPAGFYHDLLTPSRSKGAFWDEENPLLRLSPTLHGTLVASYALLVEFENACKTIEFRTSDAL